MLSKYVSLTKRNCKVFLKDRSAVAFSLLSMLVVLMLQGIFLGDMNVEEVTGLLAKYGGIRDAALDLENAGHLVQYWTLAGILIVNAVTVTLTVTGVMVNDAGQNKLASFYSSPVSKKLVALSYVTAAILIGTLFCTLTFAFSSLYIVANGGELLSAAAFGQMILYILMNVCIFAVIMYMAALFTKSSSAWSGIGTIVGTLVGFVGAIYLPMGSLPEGVGEVLKFIPILHGASLMRSICCKDALAAAFYGLPEEVTAGYKEAMGITVVMNGHTVGSGFQIAFLCACGAAALAVILIFAGKKKSSDR